VSSWMPASADWPERTLISPILTVPCALADETPSTSATAQPSPTRIRFIVILPACSLPNNCKKNCTHESLRGREVRRPRRWAPPHLRNGVSRGCNIGSRPRFRAQHARLRTSRDRDGPSSKRKHWRARRMGERDPRYPRSEGRGTPPHRALGGTPPPLITEARPKRRPMLETAETIGG